MKLGYIGLGKMGSNMVERLLEKGHEVSVFDTNNKALEAIAKKGATSNTTLQELINSITAPRTIWIMVPHNVVDVVLRDLSQYLSHGDIVIDGGNSFYKESIRRAKDMTERGVEYLDVGVSGGPSGARNGACLMVGGKKELYERTENLFRDIAAERAYGYMGKSGAGHFVKMVHNGIEYGIMQSIAEGFAVMKKSDYKLNLEKIADVYNHESVISSRLVGWLETAYEKYGDELEVISGSIAQSGEGAWTLQTAKELGIPVPVIEESVKFRLASAEKPSYTGKIVSALRNQFGGHDVKKN
jgi:6-phosphogluconate dehydrogenase